MDFIFLFTGMICLGEAVFLFLGTDMLIFNGTTFKQKDYDMKRLSRVEGALFLVDAAACLALGALHLEMRYQMVCLGIVFVTLLFHGRNFSSGKYKVKHGNQSFPTGKEKKQ